MRICLIYNKQAGAADLISKFMFHLDAEHRCELRTTSTEQHAGLIAREAVKEGYDRIVAAGGDGTLNQIVNGIAPDFDAVELALLPLGTGNDLGRVLNLSVDNQDEACARALSRHVEPVDVIRIFSADSYSYCINVANGGMGGRVAMDVKPEDKKRWGAMAYWITSISRLVDLSSYQATLTLDGRDYREHTLCIAVANGRFVGGGFPIAPRAMLNDGFLDVTVVPVLPIFELMAAGFNFVLARDHRDDRIRCYRARSVRIQTEPIMPFSIDGEPARRIDATFEVIPSALRFVTSHNEPGLLPADQRGSFIS